MSVMYLIAPSAVMCRTGREELGLVVEGLRGLSVDVETGHLGPEQLPRICPIGNKDC